MVFLFVSSQLPSFKAIQDSICLTSCFTATQVLKSSLEMTFWEAEWYSVWWGRNRVAGAEEGAEQCECKCIPRA